MEMLRRVLVFRGITAGDLSTGHAKAQVHPGVPHAKTFLASLALGVDILDFGKVRTGHSRFLAQAGRRMVLLGRACLPEPFEALQT
jgi:hypothetical protein